MKSKALYKVVMAISKVINGYNKKNCPNAHKNSRFWS